MITKNGARMYVMSRAKAKRLGKTIYFTGKECDAGHLCNRRVSDGECCQCHAKKKVGKYHEYANTDEIRNYHREYYQKKKTELAARQKEYSAKNASYESFGEKMLPIDTPTKADNGDLLVSCYHCKKLFSPTRRQASRRLEVINGKYPPGQEHNFYCSNECKSGCSIYRKRSVQSGMAKKPDIFESSLLKQWANDVKELAGNVCERCGSSKNLHAHHIEPKSTNPNMAYDIENGVCLCFTCHFTYGHRGDCSANSLGKIAC